MWTLVAILAALAVVVDSQTTSEYAALCANHTMVIYPAPGPLCNVTYQAFVSDADKVRIVDEQNALRRRVALGNEIRGKPANQPAAADMKKLVWDDELATVAQRWANQCDYGHDQCRKVPRFYVGQNVYRVMSSVNSTSVNWTRATNKWYDEVDSFNSANISPFGFNSTSAHYTALLWANTEFIGCGFTFYKSTLSTESNTPYVKYFVCNYGQGGNYVNGTMYTVGTPCSQCPTGKVCENGLCA